MKRCPFCAEMIKAEAIKCRFCESMLPDTEYFVAKKPDTVIFVSDEPTGNDEPRKISALAIAWCSIVTLILVAGLVSVASTGSQSTVKNSGSGLTFTSSKPTKYTPVGPYAGQCTNIGLFARGLEAALSKLSRRKSVHLSQNPNTAYRYYLTGLDSILNSARAGQSMSGTEIKKLEAYLAWVESDFASLQNKHIASKQIPTGTAVSECEMFLLRKN